MPGLDEKPEAAKKKNPPTKCIIRTKDMGSAAGFCYPQRPAVGGWKQVCINTCDMNMELAGFRLWMG